MPLYDQEDIAESYVLYFVAGGEERDYEQNSGLSKTAGFRCTYLKVD